VSPVTDCRAGDDEHGGPGPIEVPGLRRARRAITDGSRADAYRPLLIDPDGGVETDAVVDRGELEDCRGIA